MAIAVASIIALGGFFFSTSAAFADRSFESEITGFVEANTLAIDGSENVWIRDRNSGILSEYSSSGTLLKTQTVGGGYVLSMALNNTTGYLYVANSGPVDVEVFDNTGAISETWNTENSCGLDFVAVDNAGGPSQGDVYVARSCGGPQHIQRLTGKDEAANFSGSAEYIEGNHIIGTPGGEIGSISNIATDPEGNLYVVENSKQVVDEFNSSGIFVRAFTGAGAPQSFNSITGVAVDPTNGNVLIVDSGNHVVDEFESGGGYIDQITGTGPAQETPFSNLSGGIAVNSGGFVYVANGSSVDIFTPNVIVPKVSYGAVTNTNHTSGTLNATIDPNEGGTVISCVFEYGTTTSYGTTVPCSPAPPYVGKQAVDANISGLTAEKTYDYRVVASNANGTRKGPNQTYKPLAVNSLTTETATEVRPNYATLNGSFAGDGEATEYYFEYGPTTSYGTKTSITSAGSPSSSASISAKIEGLTAQSTYHYRAVAVDGFGTSYGADQSVTTPPAVTALSTSEPTNPVPGSETLNGSFAGEGVDTTYYFEYVDYANYEPTAPDPYAAGEKTSLADAGPGTGEQHISALATFPFPYILYHYRVVASNSYGTTFGPDQTLFSPLPEPPSVDGTSSSNIAPTLVTLNTKVRPGYGPTVVRFEYGESTSYGLRTYPTESVGNENSDVLASIEVSELQPATTYHFRAVVTNFAGTVLGPDMTFTTPAVPTLAETVASAVTQTTATLGARIHPGYRATTYHFEYGRTTGYGASTPESGPIGSDNGVYAARALVSGLLPQTTYHYRIVASNEVGKAVGPDGTFTTLPAAAVGVQTPTPTPCKKSFARKRGKCVKKIHTKSKHHRKGRS